MKCDLCGGPWHLTPQWVDDLDHDCPGQDASDDVKAEWYAMFDKWDTSQLQHRYQPKPGERVDKQGLIYNTRGKFLRAIPDGTVPSSWRWRDGQWHTDEAVDCNL